MPTPRPTPQPTPGPTSKPTAAPTAEPTPRPSAVPTAAPTAKPTAEPSSKPTAEPKRRGRLVHAQRGKKDRQPRRSFFTKRGEKPVLRMRVSLPTSTRPCTSKLFILVVAHPPLSRATRAEAPLRSRGTRTHLVYKNTQPPLGILQVTTPRPPPAPGSSAPRAVPSGRRSLSVARRRSDGVELDAAEEA